MDEKEMKKLFNDSMKKINLGNKILGIFLELATDEKDSSGVRMQKKASVIEWQGGSYTITIERGDQLNFKRKKKS